MKKNDKYGKVAFPMHTQHQTKTSGVRMLEAASSLEDREFFLRLNTIPNTHDAVT